MLDKIKVCFTEGQLYYSGHARHEMETEELGEIKEEEVHSAVLAGSIIEDYFDHEPYSSCLIFGRTPGNRPLHIVCAFDEEECIAIVVAVYQPDPAKWIELSRRRQ